VVIERLRAEAAIRVMDSQGLPGAPVEGITLRDCNFRGVTQPSIARHTRDITLGSVRTNGRYVDRL
jgi:hypothetical protein